MVLGRNGLRDERRRRVLIDETLHGGNVDASDAPLDGAARAPATTYAAAAQVQHHAPISVCIPKRSVSLWGILLAGAVLIAGIEVLYSEVYLRVRPELRGSLTALDVMARGSLASWFASAVLCCASLGSLLVYLIRRHRMDDYRGRYRWWLWLAPLLLVVSINAGTGLHQAISGVLTSISGAEMAVGGKGWWLLAYLALVLPIGSQLAIELWRSRLATVYFWGSLVAYGVAAAFELQALTCATELATTVTHSSILLAAHFGVLLTVLAFARYVYLEAQDSIPEKRSWGVRLRRRARRPQESTAAAAEAKGEAEPVSPAAGRIRVDESHSQFSRQVERPPQVSVSAEAVDADSDGDRKLSKADRKRLRRETQR